MTAVSGSRTQPSFSHESPNWNQRKLNTCREIPSWPEWCSALAKAMQDNTSAQSIEPMASEAANFRWRCGATALKPPASRGKAGISQRFGTIQFIKFESSSHRVDLIHICRFIMAIDGN